MKLYLLAKRLKANLRLKKKNNYKYLILGATLFILLSGFFCPQNALSKQTIKKVSSSNLSTIFDDNKNKILISKKRSCIEPIINIENIDTLIIPKSKETELQKNVTNDLKNTLSDILVDTPMESMIELISQQDKIVAAFLVGIALKESQFGKHSPKLNGQDCFNYWGYRGVRKRMGSGGHTCFDSPEDAINTVAKRIKTLAITQHRNTPGKMIIWKCGNSCATHSPASVSKWISDVSIYFNKINNS
jgi:hypothetical protein